MKYITMEVDVTYKIEVTASVSDATYDELKEISDLHHGRLAIMDRGYPLAADFLSSKVDDEDAYDVNYRIVKIRDIDS